MKLSSLYEIAIDGALCALGAGRDRREGREALEEMRARDTFSAGSLWRTEATHAVTLIAVAVGIFFVFGAAGLLLDQIASPVAGETYEEPILMGNARKVYSPQLLTAGPSWLSSSEAYATHEESPLHALPDAEEVQAGTPLVLIASGLAEFEVDPERELLLEPDGSLRIEGSGTLVGFLQSGQSCELGESVNGPGQIEFKLLHHKMWVAERVRVPIVESVEGGLWIVQDYRDFGVGVQAEAEVYSGIEPVTPLLNVRTGLPLVELFSDPR